MVDIDKIDSMPVLLPGHITLLCDSYLTAHLHAPAALQICGPDPLRGPKQISVKCKPVIAYVHFNQKQQHGLTKKLPYGGIL